MSDLDIIDNQNEEIRKNQIMYIWNKKQNKIIIKTENIISAWNRN